MSWLLTFPWLPPIAQSLQAGFWEECLFRAVPLAGAALLGDRFGSRKGFLAAGFVLGSYFWRRTRHYPSQPAYARVVELIIPSFVFGGLYLTFGLLPAIISHFTFDVVWFSIPLFVSTASGVWSPSDGGIAHPYTALGRSACSASNWKVARVD